MRIRGRRVPFRSPRPLGPTGRLGVTVPVQRLTPAHLGRRAGGGGPAASGRDARLRLNLTNERSHDVRNGRAPSVDHDLFLNAARPVVEHEPGGPRIGGRVGAIATVLGHVEKVHLVDRRDEYRDVRIGDLRPPLPNGRDVRAAAIDSASVDVHGNAIDWALPAFAAFAAKLDQCFGPARERLVDGRARWAQWCRSRPSPQLTRPRRRGSIP